MYIVLSPVCLGGNLSVCIPSGCYYCCFHLISVSQAVKGTEEEEDEEKREEVAGRRG